MDGCVYRSQFDFCEKNKEKDEKRGIRRWCDFEECKEKHPSNADRIRNMTDEELAEFLLNRDLDVVEKASKSVGFTYKVDREPCLVNVIDWLRQEAEEDE